MSAAVVYCPHSLQSTTPLRPSLADSASGSDGECRGDLCKDSPLLWTPFLPPDTHRPSLTGNAGQRTFFTKDH